MMGIDSMAVPPIAKYGPEHLKQAILPAVVKGKMHVALAITEGTAGSDVANIRTSAVKSEDGKFYLINGQKKWLSGYQVATFAVTSPSSYERGKALEGKGFQL
jgi:alkylation response protein AidB-like acyl-CoA dehydrogenase